MSTLNADPSSWLLEDGDPSVRFFTLIDILGKPADDPHVINAKQNIMKRGLVPKILEKQAEGGYWGKPEDFYIRSKFKGTVWTLILLAELGADGADPRIKKACEFVLGASQDPESGGFAYADLKGGGRGLHRYENLKAGGRHGAVLPCLTGNMVWCLLKFGYLDDPRIRQSIDFITRYQRFDDGIEEPPAGWPYDGFEKCWGRHTCHMGVVKALKALAEIPVERRTKAVDDTIGNAAEYLLKHHVFKKSHSLDKVSRPDWLRFGFPRMYNTDVLEILGILAKLGYRDVRMQEAVDLVLSKQDAQGRWLQEDRLSGRYLVRIEEKDKPSKWVTLNALRALKSYYG